MFLKLVLFCSKGLGRIYRQVQWKFYYLNKGILMGLSNEISFILIFLAVPVQQVKMIWSKLAVRRYLSSSVPVLTTAPLKYMHRFGHIEYIVSKIVYIGCYTTKAYTYSSRYEPFKLSCDNHLLHFHNFFARISAYFTQ